MPLNTVNGDASKRTWSDLPGCDEVKNIRMLVDVAVIHDDNRIMFGERPHSIQQTTDKQVV
jgi:hypothetical protein